MSKKQYGYLFGNKGRRKTRSPWFLEEWRRDMYAAADKTNGFRVRKYSRNKKTGGKVV